MFKCGKEIHGDFAALYGERERERQTEKKAMGQLSWIEMDQLSF